MKKSLILGLIILIVSVVLLLPGCSAIFNTTQLGDAVNKTYDFSNFTNIQISNSFRYDVEQSDTYSVNVSTYSSLADKLDVHQSGNTLYVSMKNNTFFGINIGNDNNPSVTITLPQLNKLAVSGSCTGTAAGFNSSNDLEVDISASSRANLDITAGKTTMNISSSSDISGNLNAADTTIGVSSSSDLNMDLATAATSLTVSGSSHAAGELTAANTHVTVQSSSNLNMTMKTADSTFTASGSSGINGNLEAQNCTFNISSSSRCNLTGNAADANISVSSSSSMSSPNLLLKSAVIVLNSSSRADIYTNGTLDINASGSSHLNYYGNPTITRSNVNSSSGISHK